MNRHRTGNRRRKEHREERRGGRWTRWNKSLHVPNVPLGETVLRNVSSFVAALRFLTVIPLPGSLGDSKEDLARSVPFFPLIGMLLGCVVVPLAWGLHLLLPPPVTAVLLTLALFSFSGGLHLDGLADTADGFFSARPKKRMLEIMRDSATGAMGVIALVLLLLLKVACLSMMPGNTLVFAAFLMPVAGRVAILLLMGMLPYIRSDGGIGTVFSGYYDNRHAMTLALTGLVFFGGMAWAVAGVRGIVSALAVLLLTALFAAFCRRKIGGVTGDTLGAACELAEAVVALVFVLHLGGAV